MLLNPLDACGCAGSADERVPLRGRWQPKRRCATTADATGLAVGFVIEHRDLAGATPSDDSFAIRSDTPILAERRRERGLTPEVPQLAGGIGLR
jgi:hypothetical protein